MVQASLLWCRIKKPNTFLLFADFLELPTERFSNTKFWQCSSMFQITSRNLLLFLSQEVQILQSALVKLILSKALTNLTGNTGTNKLRWSSLKFKKRFRQVRMCVFILHQSKLACPDQIYSTFSSSFQN